MITRTQGVPRRVVIEAYARYDVTKKNRSLPNFESWDWSVADAIDEEMSNAGLKAGIPAGYLFWEKVEITLGDLRLCAVDAAIFPGQPRRVNLIDAEAMKAWSSRCDRPWYQAIASGQTLNEVAPMLLRPAVSSESPAAWYVEDGSGRALAFISNQRMFNPAQTVATGYLGVQPDNESSFMRMHFRELLLSKSLVCCHAL